jgi:hypothetical protein
VDIVVSLPKCRYGSAFGAVLVENLLTASINLKVRLGPHRLNGKPQATAWGFFVPKAAAKLA